MEYIPMRRVGQAAAVVAEVVHTYPAILAGIPRGGIAAAYAVACAVKSDLVSVVSSAELQQKPSAPAKLFLVDDLMFSGETLKREAARLKPDAGLVLFLKKDDSSPIIHIDFPLHVGEDISADKWVTFPWERNDADGGRPEASVRRLIEYLGDDPTRDGLLKTPERYLDFLDEQRITTPYEATTFESDITDLSVTNSIPLAGLCEHHMLPYLGIASVGYIPDGKLLGLSKIARIVADCCKGLTMQEVVTAQVADAVKEATGSQHVAVITTASHSCMIMRGVKAVGATTTSSAMLGKFRGTPALRAEFMELTKVS